jgi:hypothetical protein
MTDHEIYIQELGPEVAACIERTIQAEREARAAVADARGGSAWERVSGKAEFTAAPSHIATSSATKAL